MENSAADPKTALTWHIVWQLASGRDLLAEPAVAERIRSRLLDAHRRPDRALLHYLLLPSEIHLLSRLPAHVSPRDVARAIGNIVARWVRQAHGGPGPVFAGRYRAYAVESDEAVRNEIRLLAWRPVATGVCRAPSHHATSSLRTVLGMRRPQGFDVMTPLRLFGDSVLPAREALRGLIARRPGPVEIRQWELTRGLLAPQGEAGGASLATSRALHDLAAALVAASNPPTIDGALALLERWVALKLGLRDASPSSSSSPSPLAMLSSAAGARGRALVACVAIRLELCSAATVARHFKRAKATLSERMAACRMAPENQSLLAMPPARIVAQAIELSRAADAQLAALVRRSAPIT